ncbi:hypothetical protein HID58_066868 [Brassica napus]|uniref:RNase H type-1 domain-containing protein n=1 Tax=Brassica napus TaxID=3708 RepID=A0ABQ7ZH46_BRANA|nr:hypothetical protein HID58_066868 [Brassica napus]
MPAPSPVQKVMEQTSMVTLLALLIAQRKVFYGINQLIREWKVGTGVKRRTSQGLVREGWVQCSLEFDWTKKSDVMGAAWMVKNDRGMVLEHSRRAFVGVLSLHQAKLKVWLWVFESMRSLRKKKVVFVSTAEDIVEAIERPTLSPALQYEAEEIKSGLKAFEAWELRIGGLEAVRSVYFIAKSVRSLGMMQSYVAAGHPR